MSGMLTYHETPIHEIIDPKLERSGITLFVKREDLNHPFVSGNKWWKLKYNLAEAKRLGQKTLLTFGGAYSNHIYATAAAARELGFKSIGVIRGEELSPSNPTLSFAESCGMKFRFISRERYRGKGSEQILSTLREEFGDFYHIPEGGTNELAIKGVQELARKTAQQVDYVCCPVGTGGTLAGLINEMAAAVTVVGFSALKGNFLRDEVASWLVNKQHHPKWDIITDYHFGGYGKYDEKLLEFISYQGGTNQLPLEHVYTGKCLYGIYDLIKKNYFEKGSRILFLHTGGLQGILHT